MEKPATAAKADSFGRLAATSNNTKRGRGAVVGWTSCPLCARHSQKKFALGRGIAAHLHAVHTPWKPGKAERRKRRREKEREQAVEARKAKRRRRNSEENQEATPDSAGASPSQTPQTTAVPADSSLPETWEPSKEEIARWEARVLAIVKELEEAADAKRNEQAPLVDRTGRQTTTYRDSLPPFLAAASNGDLKNLQHMVASAAGAEVELLNTKDRHLSTGEHWAAGEGHLDCLKFLFDTRQKHKAGSQSSSADAEKETETENASADVQPKKMRRRDGKTCLHYAARNGRLKCAQYLVLEQGFVVDEGSGDGTTPFHLACYGLHMETVRFLVERGGANPKATNDWGCGAAHWIAMAKTSCRPEDDDETFRQVAELCTWLQSDYGVDFTLRQKHGHTALHKAAQAQNYAMLTWLIAEFGNNQKGLGSADVGGHSPSEILQSVGGDTAFAKRMQEEQGW